MTHKLFSQPCEFIAGAASVDSLPKENFPEVAFIGRSNVGKSSLVNALIGRKEIARTSANPGMTKQLNFFQLGNQLMLVDMPGYGYAKVSKTRKGEWDTLIKSYLSGRTTLKRALVLIDARRGVMEHDDAFMTMLDESAVNFQIVLTKIDALSDKDLVDVILSTKQTIAKHVAAHPELIATSSLKKHGIDDLQEQILPFAR